MQPIATSRSITKSVDLRVPQEVVFDFLNNPMNWPKWAIINLKSVTPGNDVWYETETRQGRGRLKMLSNKPLGILDHQWQDPQASWTVPARVVPNGGGCTFLMTVCQPPAMDDETFNAAAKDGQIERNT